MVVKYYATRKQRVCIELLMMELCCNNVRTTCVHRSSHDWTML